MEITRAQNLVATALMFTLALATTLACATDPLPSWNDGPTKQGIITFVEKVTKEGSPSFVPIPERIATFDNDGMSGASSRCRCNCISHLTG